MNRFGLRGAGINIFGLRGLVGLVQNAYHEIQRFTIGLAKSVKFVFGK